MDKQAMGEVGNWENCPNGYSDVRCERYCSAYHDTQDEIRTCIARGYDANKYRCPACHLEGYETTCLCRRKLTPDNAIAKPQLFGVYEDGESPPRPEDWYEHIQGWQSDEHVAKLLASITRRGFDDALTINEEFLNVVGQYVKQNKPIYPAWLFTAVVRTNRSHNGRSYRWYKVKGVYGPGLGIRDIQYLENPGNGQCLFYSLVDSLTGIRFHVHNMRQFDDQAQQLRLEVAAYIKSDADLLTDYLAYGSIDDLVRSTAPADAIQIRAAAAVLDHGILLVNIDPEKKTIIGQHYFPGAGNPARAIMVVRTGEHFCMAGIRLQRGSNLVIPVFDVVGNFFHRFRAMRALTLP